MTDNGDIIMTIRDVASYLRVAESTIYKLANEGQLPGRKVGGGWRFSRKELERWLLRPEHPHPDSLPNQTPN